MQETTVIHTLFQATYVRIHVHSLFQNAITRNLGNMIDSHTVQQH